MTTDKTNENPLEALYHNSPRSMNGNPGIPNATPNYLNPRWLPLVF